MFDYAYIVGPAMGGVIGYITNALAIRMLFRPYKAKYIGKWRIPFTPGIIPKEKERIAAAIGGAVSDNLMNRDVLEKTLLSMEMLEKIRSGVLDFYRKQSRNHQTLREFVGEYVSPDTAELLLSGVKQDLSQRVGNALGEAEISNKIADAVTAHLFRKMRSEDFDISGLSGFSSALKFGPLRNKLADIIEVPIKGFLTQNISRILNLKGEQIADSMIESQIERLSETEMCVLLAGHDAEADQIADGMVNAYQIAISQQLPRILENINIASMIEGRINEMDMAETERLIFQVMNKELRAIIWLGAFLGTLMGTVNAFI